MPSARERYNAGIDAKLDTLISKSLPYEFSSPKYGQTTILDFVKGLIIATNIMQVISEYLPLGLNVDWGQIIDEKNGNILSYESDIIIYRGNPGCTTIKNDRMRFVVVDKRQAKLVVQVKSCINAVRESDRTYCKELRKFVPKVWYLAECCWAGSQRQINTLEQRIKNAGYQKFIYFYAKNDDATIWKTAYPQFRNFIESIKSIR